MIRNGTPQRTVATGLAAIGVLGVLGALGIGGVPGTGWRAPAAEAAAASNCANGVVVAVDFAHWGKPVQKVCDVPVPKSAAQVLVNAKFDPKGVAEYSGLSFICTIDGYPRDDGCATTPTGAYWSFWYAKAGSNQWTYSPLGAESLAPTVGSVEGWFFGTNTGSTPPAGLPLPNAIRSSFRPRPTTTTSSTTTTTTPPSATTTSTTSPATTSPPTTRPATTRPAKVRPSKRPVTSTPCPKTSPHSRAAPRQTTTSSPTTKSATACSKAAAHPHPHPAPRETAKTVDPNDPAPTILQGPAAVADRSDSGSPLPAVVGAAVMLGIGGSAWVIARRRRRSEGE